ncbi:hypothetical protein [Nocardia crassostreae]|uniref:hypothetical protein n=1 Tax=Nocardia crassostreae TaxID=53428 RepID=UPI0012FC47FB|nr:hypothetical protein [Nocardia crassostreae]
MMEILIPVIGTLSGVFVANIMTLAAGSRRARTDREIAHRQLEAQLRLAQQQHTAQLEIEREKQRRQEIDEAYGQLMVWLHEMQGRIDDIWIAVYSDEPDLIERVRNVLRDWPFGTLRPPREAAPTQYYWSSNVRKLVASLGGASFDLTSSATAVLNPRESPLADDHLASLRGRVGNSRDELTAMIIRIHEAVGREMRAEGGDQGS